MLIDLLTMYCFGTNVFYKQDNIFIENTQSYYDFSKYFFNSLLEDDLLFHSNL